MNTDTQLRQACEAILDNWRQVDQVHRGVAVAVHAMDNPSLASRKQLFRIAEALQMLRTSTTEEAA